MEYIVKKTQIIDPDINSPEWDRANTGRVEIENWTGFFPAPETTFKLLRGPKGISVLMHTSEKMLRAECKNENGEVCSDSCMEFFFRPDGDDDRYINLEVNPKGVMLLGIGSDRYGRHLINTDRKIFSIVSLAEDGNWKLKYYIPDKFLTEHFKKASSEWRANFYKCGDETGHAHYASWTKINSKEPDFHLSEFFGVIKMEDL